MSETKSKATPETVSNDEFAIDPDAWRTPDPAYLEHLRRKEQALRKSNTRHGFHRACSEKPCGRAKACVGDAEACFRQWWRHVHPQVRAAERAFHRARFDGMEFEEARRRAGAAWDEWWRDFEAGKCNDEARAFLEGPLAHLPPVP